METLEFIDFHHHARPVSFWKAMSERGVTIHGGRPLPPIPKPAETIAMMDRLGISTTFLSAPDAEVAFVDREFGVTQSRAINEFYADIMREHPTRFGAFASLPMPHTDAALKELEYALDTLGFHGVLLLTSYNGVYTGSAEIDPILDECNRRGAFVMIHPSTPIGMDLMKIDFPCFVLEFVNDTSRCVLNILRHDVSTRYPKIRFMFAHAGGTAPYLASRLALMDLFADPNNTLSIPEAREKALAGLRSFYYDTALSVADPVLKMLADVVGIDRVLFGADYPQAKEPFVADTVDGVRHSKVLSPDDRRAVARGNALKLFPQFSRPGDAQ